MEQIGPGSVDGLSLTSLDARLTIVEKNQRERIGVFDDIVKRFPDMRQTLHKHSNALMGIDQLCKTLTTNQETISGQVAKVGSDVGELLSVWTATKGTAAFIKKHGPRLLAFGFGIASAFGFSNPKLEQVLSSLF